MGAPEKAFEMVGGLETHVELDKDESILFLHDVRRRTQYPLLSRLRTAGHTAGIEQSGKYHCDAGLV